MSCLAAPDGHDGPAGCALLDHETFEVIGQCETDRRAISTWPTTLWWHINHTC
jgi:selenium-binding protein 1